MTTKSQILLATITLWAPAALAVTIANDGKPTVVIVLADDPIPAEETAARETIRKHIRPLVNPLGDRLLILTWQSRGFPTGLENGQVEQVQQLLMDRGLSPLCNPMANRTTAEQYVPILPCRQSRGYPVCVLPQGWLQAEFVPDRRGRLRSAHQAPAQQSEEFPCPALLQDPRKLQR